MFLKPKAALLVVSLGAASVAALAGPSGLWLDVPFVRQPRNGCAAACVAMVIEYWHDRGASCPPATVTEIDRRLSSDAGPGVRASAVELYLKDTGFRVFSFRGTLPDLRHHLAKGRPLIVALEESRNTFHDVVVVGLDEDGSILVNDPARRKLLKMDRRDFENRWSLAQNWTLLAVPDGPSSTLHSEPGQ